MERGKPFFSDKELTNKESSTNTVTKNIFNKSREAEFTQNVGFFCCKTAFLFLYKNNQFA